MMQPFIAFVPSLIGFQAQGVTDALWRRGNERNASVVGAVGTALAEYAGQNLNAVPVPTGDDELGDAEIWVVKLNPTSLKGLQQGLAPALAAIARKEAKRLTAENVFGGVGDDAAETLASVLAVRAFLVAAEGFLAVESGDDPAIVMEAAGAASKAVPVRRRRVRKASPGLGSAKLGKAATGPKMRGRAGPTAAVPA